MTKSQGLGPIILSGPGSLLPESVDELPNIWNLTPINHPLLIGRIQSTNVL